MSIQESTAERLREYYPFSESVIERVSELADRQAGFKTYPEFLKFAGVEFDGSVPEYIDIRPKEHDHSEAIVAHLSMANPLNPHNIYGVAGLAVLNPNKRVIAFGNPSQPGMSHGTLSRRDRKAVAKGDFTPAVSSLVRYLEAEGIEEVSHVGSSYGSELAIAASLYDVAEVNHIVVSEPVTNKAKKIEIPKLDIPLPRLGIVKLGLEFASSDERMNEYVEKNGIPNYEVAFAEKGGLIPYSLGLLRPTNIANSRGLAKGGFFGRANRAMLVQKNAVLTGSRGTESELNDGESFDKDFDSLNAMYPGRVFSIVLDRQAHAMGNDLALYNAINLTGLEK
jgi:pimeloyl-ACP methyl ester carboxylesterase